MRRIAIMTALAALFLGVQLTEAAAGCRHGRRAPCQAYGAPGGYVLTARPYDAWRAYYTAQAELSYARRAAASNYYVATGRALPGRYRGPPTNYYAERYAFDTYAYFSCPQARRGEGICADPDFFKP